MFKKKMVSDKTGTLFGKFFLLQNKDNFLFFVFMFKCVTILNSSPNFSFYIVTFNQFQVVSMETFAKVFHQAVSEFVKPYI